MATTTTLLSLPNELLGKILEEYDLSLPALYELAFLCHRLHQISLSVYIKQSGLPKVSERCIVTIPYRPESHDLVTVLYLSSDVTQTQYFRCNFPKFATERGMVHHFLRVARFVAKLTVVKEVVLNFNSFEEITYVSTEDEAIAWSYGLGKLMNTIVERGCSSLEVRGLLKTMDVTVNRQVMVMPPPLPRSQPPSLFSRLRKAFKLAESTPTPSVLAGPALKYEGNLPANSEGWKINRQHILMELSPLARSHSSLTHFTIATKSFLCPPILRWTYSALSVSPITSLTIEDVDFYDHGPLWATLTELFRHAAPALKALKLKSCRRSSNGQVTQFIKGFPKLECLTLEDIHSFGQLYDRDPWARVDHHFLPPEIPGLTRLTTLRSEAKWVLPALRSYAEGSLPALQNLTIALSYWVYLGWGSNDQQLLAELAKLGRNPAFSVDVELLTPEDIVSWMRELTERNTSLEESAGWTKCVSGIILLVDRRLEWFYQPNVTDVVRRWYHQFPRLRKLIMNTRVNDPLAVSSVEQFCRLKVLGVVKGLEYFEVNGRPLQLSTETL